MAFREVKVQTEFEKLPTWDITGERTPGSADTTGVYHGWHLAPSSFNPGEKVRAYQMTVKGQKYTVWGSGKFDYLVDHSEVKEGDTIRIKYEGKEKITNKDGKAVTVKQFRLWIDDGTADSGSEEPSDIPF